MNAERKAALEFVEKGPYTLDELRVDRKDVSFSSFGAFKKIDLLKIYGPCEPGYEYHHIVEQNAEGTVPASQLNSTRNIIRIPKLLHEEITSEYVRTSSDAGARISVRKSLEGKSFEEQWEQGLKTLRDIGILK